MTEGKPIVFTGHAVQRMKERGASENSVREAIRIGERRREAMKISYDKEADALYIRLLEGEYESRVVRLTDDIALDFAAGEKLVGIEVLGASRLNLEFKREWDGRYYGVQQVAPIVKEETGRILVITVYTFYFQEGERP